jgi:predicted DsbA family dithiol-disulfide isomerase
VEVEKLQARYDVDVRFAPYLLDPTTPPEGKARKRYTNPDDPPTDMELRAEASGIKFSRGREWTSNSHLSLEAAEYASDHGKGIEFHRPVFKAYFEDLADISDIDLLVGIGKDVGLDPDDLKKTLDTRANRETVDEIIQWSRGIGVTGVPTFVFNEKYGFVGAQDFSVFESMMERIAEDDE